MKHLDRESTSVDTRDGYLHRTGRWAARIGTIAVLATGLVEGLLLVEGASTDGPIRETVSESVGQDVSSLTGEQIGAIMDERFEESQVSTPLHK
jgi:cytochrome c biogenesis protein ResB